MRIETFDLRDKIPHPLRNQKIGLLDTFEDRFLGPIFMVEAAITPCLFNHRISIDTEKSNRTVLVEGHRFLPKLHVDLCQLVGILNRRGKPFGVKLFEIERIEIQLLVGLAEIGHDILDIFKIFQQPLRQFLEVEIVKFQISRCIHGQLILNMFFCHAIVTCCYADMTDYAVSERKSGQYQNRSVLAEAEKHRNSTIAGCSRCYLIQM